MNKTYSFAIYLQDLVSSPLMKMARLYNSTLGQMTKGANKLAGIFRPAVQSVEELRRKMDALKGRRDLMVDTRKIKAANREIEQLQEKDRQARNDGHSQVGFVGWRGWWLYEFD